MAPAGQGVAPSQRLCFTGCEGQLADTSSSPILPTVTSTGSSITLSWDSGIACRHALEIERQEAFTRNRYVHVGSVSCDCQAGHCALKWTDNDLPPGATYNYRLADVASGQTQSRLFVQASTLLVPRPPSRVVATLLAGDHLGAHLTWISESSDATGFRVERLPGRTGDQAFSEIAVVWADVTDYTDCTIAPAVPYEYRVIAFNSLGDSAPSYTTTLTTDP